MEWIPLHSVMLLRMSALRALSTFLSEVVLFCGALELNIRVLNLLLAGSELFEIARTFSSMSNIDVARAFGSRELFSPEQKEALWSIGCVLASASQNVLPPVCVQAAVVEHLCSRELNNMRMSRSR